MGRKMAEDSSSDLMDRWRGGDQQAAAELFRRYAGRLITLVRGRLSAPMSRRLDPEDVVQSVYRSFFVGTQQGQLQLPPGGDLWRLLVAITIHKLHEQVRRNTRDKRNVQMEHGFGTEDSLFGIQAIVYASGPSPLETAALADELEQLMNQLEPLHRRMLELRLQGYNLDEIAADTSRSERTVIRVLERIKKQLAAGRYPEGNP